MEYITFDENDLFDMHLLETFFEDTPVQTAKVMFNELTNNYLVGSHDKLYSYDDSTKSYKLIRIMYTTPIEYLAMICRKFITESYQRLDNCDKNRMNKMYSYEMVCGMNTHRDYALDLYCLMQNNNIKFDQDNTRIQYKNGYFNLKTMKFKPRTKLCYITKFYDWDFNKDEVETIEEEEEEEEEYEEEEEEQEDGTEVDHFDSDDEEDNDDKEDDEEDDDDITDDNIKRFVNFL